MSDTLLPLAAVLAARGDLNEAELLFSEIVAAKRKLLGDSHPDLAYMLFLSAGIAQRRGNEPQAEAQLLEAWRILETTSFPIDPKRRRDLVIVLGVFYEEWSRKDPTKAKAAAQWKERRRKIE